MKKMSSEELRQSFLDFFSDKDHLIWESAPLIPQDDPTLLWINAGMTPLKSFFDGSKKPPHPRMATTQKCIRTNDIENVGRTARHHTFLEMLGNFSFGDYFKKDAIKWACEFLTEKLELDPERLWVSVYENDQEAFDLWREEIDFPEEKIAFLGKEDNFWEIGLGPCGPCSEIHWDRGEEYSCGPSCTLGCDCDRFLELWNLVFTQFDKKEDGSYETLPKKNIDTGMGLERLASVLQQAPSNYETDLFLPYIKHLEELSGVSFAESRGQEEMAFRVIVDHIRGIGFALADGALPSNEGRGYVIRRILRRAARFGRQLGLEEPFLFRLMPLLQEKMGPVFPELLERGGYIAEITRIEEERFAETIDQGLEILEDYIEQLKQEGGKTLSGPEAFKLYDTYGFPLDLTRDVLYEEGLDLDEEGFNQEMEKQRERARKDQAHKSLGFGDQKGSRLENLVKELEPTRFTGFDSLKEEARVLKTMGPGERKEDLRSGDSGFLIVDKTPFYPEGGGQAGDKGRLYNSGVKGRIKDTYQHEGLIFHEVEINEGSIAPGDNLGLEVDEGRRMATARNHTATHLLHQALRQVLGTHVQQAGSLVDHLRLRFDFSHFKALGSAELKALEKEVNRQILKNLPVRAEYMSLGEARDRGALAVFEERYQSRVRLINIGPGYSQELCGGTHLQTTGSMGPFKIISEAGIAAGIRRIEAITGFNTLEYFDKQEQRLQKIASQFKASPDELEKRLDQLVKEKELLQKKLQKAQSYSLADQARDLLQKKEQIGDITVVRQRVEVDGPQELRQLGDMIRDHLESGLILLATEQKGKAQLLTMLTQDLIKEKNLHAGKMVNEMAAILGGGGGGRPDMAQAGGPKSELIEKALQDLERFLQKEKDKNK